jgi:hypothetical protein
VSARGTYRQIPTVLVNGPDYQRLPPHARLVFLTLKITIGPSGIETRYPDSLALDMAHQTGLTPDQVRLALDILEHEGWLRREAHVIWIVEQLKYDPGFVQTNPKHRKSLRTHVAGLPRIAIVRAFVSHYIPWFKDEDTVAIGYEWAIGSLSDHRNRNRKEKPRPKPKPSPAPAPAAPAASDDAGVAGGVVGAVPASPDADAGNWVAQGVELFASRGSFKHPRVGAALKPSVERHGEAAVLKGVREYVRSELKFGTHSPEKFAERDAYWIAQAGQPTVEWGELTEAGKRRLGMTA